MSYTKKQLGKELKEKIDQNYTSRQIGKWAFEIYFHNIRDFDSEMYEIIQNLFMMEEGPEFEYTKEELELLSKKLINNEKDPLKQIDEMKKAS
jgi:hypothetical protein